MSTNSLPTSDPALIERFNAIRSFAKSVRASEYHVTNACNIRCKGCWFFEHEFEKTSDEETDPDVLRAFIGREKARGINTAILIGGEPTLTLDRVAAWSQAMDYITLSTNGLRTIPHAGFENVAVMISLFGGVGVDDDLRAIKPSGKRFTGLFDTALVNFRADPRVTFVYCLEASERGVAAVEETVRRIDHNGNQAIFGYYSAYDVDSPLELGIDWQERLAEEAHRVAAKYPKTVLSTPYMIDVMMTGRSHFGSFGYENCPSISVDHPAHAARMTNGNRVLPMFNAYAPDLKTINFCCTSGHCDGCRDSQAVYSWLLVNAPQFLGSEKHMREWVELAESYWEQFSWSPFRREKHEYRADRLHIVAN